MFDSAARALLHLARVPDDGGPSGFNASEIEILFETAAEQETIDAEGSRLARNIIRFSDTTADTVMTPRPDIVAAPLDVSREALAELMTEARHSRIPLYEGGVEHIVGFVSTKEFFLNEERSPRELIKPWRSSRRCPDRPRVPTHAEAQIADDGHRQRVRRYGGIGHRRRSRRRDRGRDLR